MSSLENKIDFAVIFSVKGANPNGDPLNGNRPRENYDGLGEVSDVCLKRKIRNRLQDMGQKIFVQSDDRSDDGCQSLRERAEKNDKFKDACQGKKTNAEEAKEIACKTWIDVRSFGQLFAFKDKDSSKNGISLGIRGPVTVRAAYSIDPVEIESIQITKSVNGEDGKDKKASDTMGEEHRVNHSTYVFFGSMNCQLAETTGFTKEDAELIKTALCTLFENDSSSARPDGSMEVNRVYWWEHNCRAGQYPSAVVHRSLKIKKIVENPKSFEDYKVEIEPLKDLEPQELIK
jgi:CRISPR-associated protein Csd2